MNRLKAIFFLLTFCSSVLGYSLELHYCKGQVTDISLFGHAECYCGSSHDHDAHDQTRHEGCKKHCHSSDEEIADTGKCCKTEKLTIHSPGVKALSSHPIPPFNLFVECTPNPYLFAGSYQKAAPDVVWYTPPVLDRDIQVLTRTFLI